jgi:RHS repeat-associated protein
VFTNSNNQVSTNLDSTHLLIREIKPDGRLLVNEYDDQGRVVSQAATVGPDLVPITNAWFTYSNNFSLDTQHTNLVSGNTWVKDVFGNVTRHEYTNGLITRVVDPLTNAIVQEWYFSTNEAGSYPRSLKSRTDHRGLTNRLYYDAQGNVVTNIVSGADLTGDGATNAISTFVFTNSLLVASTDALGRTTRYRYEDTNYTRLPTAVESYAPGGAGIRTNRMIYTNATEVRSFGTNSYTNLAYGLLLRTLEAAASTNETITDWRYNGHGFATQQILSPTNGVIETNQFVYSDRNLLSEQADAAGRLTRFFHDPLGRPQGVEKFDASGNRLHWEFSYYNDNGELSWTDGPRFDPEDYIWRDYDGAGRQTVEVRWRSQARADGMGVEAPPGDNLYTTVQNEYDAFGNLITVRDPLGNVERRFYDPIGQLTGKRRYGTTSPAPLSRETYGYEPGGQVSRITNALGGVTAKFFATTGKLVRQENPDGSVLQWRYDLAGRPVRETLSNGNYWETTYDDANSMVVRAFRLSNGTLIGTETNKFDLRGNLIQKTDLATNIYTTVYDLMNRPVRSVGPAGVNGFSDRQTNSVVYGIAGTAATNINALGEKTITTYDALGRQSTVEVRGATNQVVRTGTTFYATNHHSVTTISGSGSSAITNTVFTDNFGKTVLNQSFPSAGVTNYSTVTYDVRGNLVFSSDELGYVTARTYNSMNQLQTETLPGGATTSFAYNPAGSMTNRTMPGPLVWSAGYDSANRMTSEELSAFGVFTRHFDYAYYPSDNAFAGLLSTVTDARGVVSSNRYDQFLRLTNTAYAGALPEHSMTVSWVRDILGQPAMIRQTEGLFSTDIRIDRSYDGYGQTLWEKVSSGGALLSEMDQQWNVVGRRTQLSMAGAGTGSSIVFSNRADGALARVVQGGITNDYTYSDAGLISTRSNLWRAWTLTGRDGRGRLRSSSTTNAGVAVLLETNTWGADSRLTNYYAARQGTGSWNEGRTNAYNSRGQLISEKFMPKPSQVATTELIYDTAGMGILVKANSTGAVTNLWEVITGQLSGLGRIMQEDWNVQQFFLTARGYSPQSSSVSATLNGSAVSGVRFETNTWSWAADLVVGVGTNTLVASASNIVFTGTTATNATSVFTTPAATGALTNRYDAVGNLTNRVFSDGRTQNLRWDALGRMVMMTERDGSNNGWDWFALYDAMGRRLETVNLSVSNNVEQVASMSVVDSIYDPQVEFLEIAISVNGDRIWKVHGPDLNGVYGGMNGVGGFEGTIRETNGATQGAISDLSGNVVATVQNGSLTWQAGRVTGYGPIAGYAVPKLSLGASPAEAAVWRGKREDETGLYWLGARYYDPVSARFMSPDPMGHAASMSLYDFCNGDPINRFDADGRYGKQAKDYVGRKSAEKYIGPMLQAYQDYRGAGGGGLGVLGILNRYNLLAPLFNLAGERDFITGRPFEWWGDYSQNIGQAGLLLFPFVLELKALMPSARALSAETRALATAEVPPVLEGSVVESVAGDISTFVESKGAPIVADGDVVASANTTSSLSTSIRASHAEQAAYNQALRNGEIGLQRPGLVNQGGPDFITVGQDTAGNLVIWVNDAKSSAAGQFPRPSTAIPISWGAEVRASIAPGRLNLGNPALESQIRAAFDSGRVFPRQINVNYSSTGTCCEQMKTIRSVESWNKVVHLVQPTLTVLETAINSRAHPVFACAPNILQIGDNLLLRLPIGAVKAPAERINSVSFILRARFFTAPNSMPVEDIEGLAIFGIPLSVSAQAFLNAMKDEGLSGFALSTGINKWTIQYAGALSFEFAAKGDFGTDPTESEMLAVTYYFGNSYTGYRLPQLETAGNK